MYTNYDINCYVDYKTKNNWCIYPSYDYSHGIIDSIENITYSYCTSEFYIRRELYYWSINKLNELGEKLTPAHVTEFGKLMVDNNILSKRNITNLVNNKIYIGQTVNPHKRWYTHKYNFYKR